ncbi:MAG: relaxase/mobilization nuclease domain-containing protein [Magnetococcales bacterium]|nr:relaxase/mobilization nuclease domain-containing protein [Magnetococcales bacterium]MBF0116804.1 relaxase/mobilization nuclease domain-containing protein [Magnetococcales bacterium]
MITKGRSTTGRSLAAHLLKKDNDRVEVLGIKGAVLNDLEAAIDDWQEYSKGTMCSKPIYHAQLNPDRNLSREEWNKAIEIFEKEMGLEDYPRAVVMHEKKGREHVHLVYSRIDLETMHAWSDSWNYLKHERVSREIERQFGMEKTPGVHVERDGESRPERTLSTNAMRQGERKGHDARDVKAEVSALYAQADGDGAAFVDGLEKAGYMLARGDRRVYVVVDHAGGVYSLSRMSGVRVAELRDVLREKPLEQVPSVKDAQQEQLQKKERERPHPKPEKSSLPAVKQPQPKPEKRPEPSLEKSEKKRPDRPRKTDRTRVGALPRGEVQVAGFADGAVKTVGKAVDGLLDFFLGAPPKPTAEERVKNPTLAAQESRARRQRGRALDNMQEDLAHGRNLNIDDLANLSREDLQYVREKGEDYLQELIEERTRQRERDDGGRTREW